jgi:hypothetical protein
MIILKLQVIYVLEIVLNNKMRILKFVKICYVWGISFLNI